MRAIFVDVANELTEIAREVAHLQAALERWERSSPLAGSQREWEATHVCASATEKIYTGCERVMALLASELDGAPVAHSEGWHALLLRRLAHPYPGVREAILSDDA